MKKITNDIEVEAVCKRLRDVRIALGFKRKNKFAELFGLNPSTYQNYENDRLPPIEFLHQLKEKFPRRVDINWILTGKPETDTSLGADSGIISKDANLINLQHIEIIKQFKNENRAKDANLALLRIERADPSLFEKLVSHIEGVEWSLRMKAQPHIDRRSGTDRRHDQTGQKGPKGEERRKGNDRRKSSWGE